MAKLTEKQAFRAMVLFLEDFYKHTKSDDVAVLLGSMMFLEDGTTADPAVWQVWLESVENILSRGENIAQGEILKLIKNDEVT